MPTRRWSRLYSLGDAGPGRRPHRADSRGYGAHGGDPGPAPVARCAAGADLGRHFRDPAPHQSRRSILRPLGSMNATRCKGPARCERPARVQGSGAVRDAAGVQGTGAVQESGAVRGSAAVREVGTGMNPARRLNLDRLLKPPPRGRHRRARGRDGGGGGARESDTGGRYGPSIRVEGRSADTGASATSKTFRSRPTPHSWRCRARRPSTPWHDWPNWAPAGRYVTTGRVRGDGRGGCDARGGTGRGGGRSCPARAELLRVHQLPQPGRPVAVLRAADRARDTEPRSSPRAACSRPISP